MRLELALEQPWCIRPGWLPLLAQMVARERIDPSAWVKVANGYDPDAKIEAQTRTPGTPLDGTRSAITGEYRVRSFGPVAVIPIRGVITPYGNLMTEVSGAASFDLLARDIETVRTAEQIRAALFFVDSPGGAAAGIDGTAKQIRELRSSLPVAAFVAGLGTSAAYWLASAAGEIAANETAVLGSIGVAAMVPKQEAPDNEGVVYHEIVSSGAPNKRPDPSEPEGIASIRALLDAQEAIFVEAVAEYRGVEPARVLAEDGFGAGGMFNGREALARGMIDRVDSFQNVLAGLAARVTPGA